MSLTKRRMEADDEDMNRELRLCVGCEQRIEGSADDAESWKFEHAFDGPFTTIWLCLDCGPSTKGKCVGCKKTVSNKPPICSKCLAAYEKVIDKEVASIECARCGTAVPPSEFDEFFDSGLCGWCAHMVAKDRDDVEVIGDRSQWEPEKNLQEESNTLIRPEQFLQGEIALCVDPRLIEYLTQHPDEVYSLEPRRFEELVGDLLTQFGYSVKLGPRGRDGGVDVYAERQDAGGPELTLVQCKRHSQEHKVGEPIVKQLHTDVNDRFASRGLIVTTSYFTSTALKYINERRFKLAGADFDQLQDWMRNMRPR